MRDEGREEPTLADPGIAGDEHSPASTAQRLREQRIKRGEFGLAADEGRTKDSAGSSRFFYTAHGVILCLSNEGIVSGAKAAVVSQRAAVARPERRALRRRPGVEAPLQ